jgi:hypothetical protein
MNKIGKKIHSKKKRIQLNNLSLSWLPCKTHLGHEIGIVPYKANQNKA